MQVCIFYYPIIVVCTNGVEHAHIRRNTKVISCFTHSLILHLLCVYWHKCGCVEQRRHMAGCPSSIWRCTLSSNVSKMHNTGKWQTALQAYGDALFLQMYQKCTIQANGRQPFRHMETLVHCGPRLCAKNTHRCDIGDALCIMYYVICTINDK